MCIGLSQSKITLGFPKLHILVIGFELQFVQIFSFNCAHFKTVFLQNLKW